MLTETNCSKLRADNHPNYLNACDETQFQTNRSSSSLSSVAHMKLMKSEIKIESYKFGGEKKKAGPDVLCLEALP